MTDLNNFKKVAIEAVKKAEDRILYYFFPQKNSRKASFLENLLFSKLDVYIRRKISGQYNKLYQNSYELKKMLQFT